MSRDPAPPVRGAPLPAIDPLLQKVIAEALSRVPRDLSKWDAIERLDGHLGIDKTVYMRAYVDYVEDRADGVFKMPVTANTRPPRERPGAAPVPVTLAAVSITTSSSRNAAGSVHEQHNAAPVPPRGHALTATPYAQRNAPISRHEPPNRPQTRSQTVAGDVKTSCPFNAPARHHRRAAAASHPYRRQAVVPSSTPRPDRRRKVTENDLKLLAELRYKCGDDRLSWGEFMKAAPHHREKPRFWEKANGYYKDKIRELVEKLKADNARAAGMEERGDVEDPPPFQPDLLRDATPNLAQAAPASNAESPRLRDDTPQVKPNLLRTRTPDANHDSSSLVVQNAMREVRSNAARDVKPDGTTDAQEENPVPRQNALPEIKPDTRLLLDFDALDVKPYRLRNATLNTELDTKPVPRPVFVFKEVKEDTVDAVKLEG